MGIAETIKGAFSRWQQSVGFAPPEDLPEFKPPTFNQTPAPKLVGPDEKEKTEPIKAGILGQAKKKKKRGIVEGIDWQRETREEGNG